MSTPQRPAYAQIESAARNLLTLLTATVQTPGQNQQAQVENQGPSPSQDLTLRQANVQQEMTKSFPGLFRRERTSGKRRFPAPLRSSSPAPTKTTNLQFFLLPRPMTRTPEGSQELKMLMAGLGKRLISLAEHGSHAEISAALLAEFPKLESLAGGWMFYKAAGGSGQRKLTLIPPESEGYTVKLLKTASSNGRHVIFIIPLQEEINTEPLPANAPEFSKMPKSQCKTCGEILPLQVLALHIESCTKAIEDCEEESDEAAEPRDDHEDQEVSFVNSIHNNKSNIITTETVCPICQGEYPADVIEMHASGCSERPSTVEAPPFDRTMDVAILEALPGPSSQTTSFQNHPASYEGSSDTGNKTEDWKIIPNQARAAWLYRETVLNIHRSGKPLYLHIDLRTSSSEQDFAFVTFYKASSVEWANPLQCRLEGDPALGEGVNRFVVSRVMQRLKDGFNINFGNACVTRLFDGEPDHLVPSSSAFLVDSDLFLMAGRMIGHCFLQGGPPLTGLSPAIVHILCGGTPETAVIEINDCPDIDLREKITLLEGSSKLSADEKEKVDSLCLAWDLPLMTSGNRRWLFERLLHHAVIGRVLRQIKQIRKGLKETSLWTLIRERPDVAQIIFPRESSAVLTPESILDRIRWPTMTDDDDDDDCSVEEKSRVTGYLRQFIQNASTDELKALIKFWVGWEAPTQSLNVEISHSSLPRASTCFETLRLPSHYKEFEKFKKDLMASVNTHDTGFGLV